ncbi:hypothetical protein SCP_0400320 [Sparassis crispa]|uniref:Uncharacterized protein n=1 Tax=Sparassis crispa TaxID=139825 RepID=A0A401GHR4_9APHY|nr:hypothetical protein SCP_0400320 [Sparassis crispa]GBE81661.1 hypothetical protein SCP_0400320 [Sparassis crispa]
MALQFSLIPLFHRIHSQLRRLMSDQPPQQSWADNFSKEGRGLPVDTVINDYQNRGWVARDLYISVLKFYKHDKGVEHEFLIGTVVNSAGKEVGFILVERQGARIGRGASAKPLNAALGSSGSTAAPPAHDVLFMGRNHGALLNLAGRTARSTVHGSYTVPPEKRADSIASLLAACFVAHEIKEKYDAFETNCYWFAGVVYNLVTGDNININSDSTRTVPIVRDALPEGDIQLEPRSLPQAGGAQSEDNIQVAQDDSQSQVPQRSKTGHFGSLAIVRPADIRADADEIRADFRKKTEEIVSAQKYFGKLPEELASQTARANMADARADTEERLKKEESARAEEERLRAEEERLRADTEERLKKEESARAEEERLRADTEERLRKEADARAVTEERLRKEEERLRKEESARADRLAKENAEMAKKLAQLQEAYTKGAAGASGVTEARTTPPSSRSSMASAFKRAV